MIACKEISVTVVITSKFTDGRSLHTTCELQNVDMTLKFLEMKDATTTILKLEGVVVSKREDWA